MNTCRRGFTVIELLVVVAIIAVLAAVLFASFGDARSVARDEARKSELRELQLAIELYKSQNGSYPARGCSVTSGWVGPGPMTSSWGSSCDEYIDGLVPTYISELPTDPSVEDEDRRGFMYITDGSRSWYKVVVYNSVESNIVESYSNEFARCPYDCGFAYCDADPESASYAVYAAGAECI